MAKLKPQLRLQREHEPYSRTPSPDSSVGKAGEIPSTQNSLPCSLSTFFSFSIISLNPSFVNDGLALLISSDGDFVKADGNFQVSSMIRVKTWGLLSWNSIGFLQLKKMKLKLQFFKVFKDSHMELTCISCHVLQVRLDVRCIYSRLM